MPWLGQAWGRYLLIVDSVSLILIGVDWPLSWLGLGVVGWKMMQIKKTSHKIAAWRDRAWPVWLGLGVVGWKISKLQKD